MYLAKISESQGVAVIFPGEFGKVYHIKSGSLLGSDYNRIPLMMKKNPPPCIGVLGWDPTTHSIKVYATDKKSQVDLAILNKVSKKLFNEMKKDLPLLHRYLKPSQVEMVAASTLMLNPERFGLKKDSSFKDIKQESGKFIKAAQVAYIEKQMASLALPPGFIIKKGHSLPPQTIEVESTPVLESTEMTEA